MWITGEVNAPQELIDALEDGSLVFFVGAGVSMAAPSNLPSFDGLVRDVYRAAGRQYVDGEQLDRALGRLSSDHGVDVHQRVAELIGEPSSLPNELHKSLVRLAECGGVARIVTTNYDLHLSSLMGRDVEVFHAPALPVGDDFDGIVHLHGSLGRSPRHCVVTDDDFGRAYLTEGWATRFLDRMFRKHVVLFVGYSHTDVVMHYLARGLPRDSLRFALTHEPEADRWRSLNVRPVGYPETNGDHSALARFLVGWAEVASYGLLDHRQRAQVLLSSAVPLVPEELDYALALFRRLETTRLFTEFARSP